MMEYLLELGFDINEMNDRLRGPYGHGSPLMSAMRYRKVERVRFLLENGADSYLKNCRGRSAFDEAQQLRYTDSSRLISRIVPS